MSFESPNYTQVPNDLFDEKLADMGYAELKVTLAVIRETLGYHKVKKPISIRSLVKMTGLALSAVQNGAEQGEARGTLCRTVENGLTVWELCLQQVHPVPTAGTPRTSNRYDLHLSKEKKEKKESEVILR